MNSDVAWQRGTVRPAVVLPLFFGAALVGAVLALFVARSFETDVEADSSPRYTTSLVENGPVTETIVVAGIVTNDRRLEVDSPIVPAETRRILVTEPPPLGAVVEAGDLLFEVAGMPVVVLRGQVPQYRRWVPGNSGDDIAQLQAALRDVGFDLEQDGIYGNSTHDALKDLFESHGYDLGVASPTLGQLVFFPEAHAIVVDRPYLVGDEVDDPVLTLATTAPRATAVIDSALVDLLRSSEEVSVMVGSPALNTPVMGLLGDVSAVDSGEVRASPQPAEFFRISVDLNALSLDHLPQGVADADASISFTVEVAGVDSLVVPFSALTADAAGQQILLKVDDEGQLSPIDISLDGIVGARAIIRPSTQSDLAVGDRVVIANE